MNQTVKIIPAGGACPMKTNFRQILGQKGVLTGCLDRTALSLLAGGVQLMEDLSVVGQRDFVIWFLGEESADRDAILAKIRFLMERRPAGVVLITDHSIYGTCFGTGDTVKETELGYASHTQEEDTEVWNMRFAEHLISRLAKEEGMPFCIARAHTSLPSNKTIVQSVLRVLFYGVPGEVYNIAGPDDGKEAVSPLSPESIVPDLTKLEGLHVTA